MNQFHLPVRWLMTVAAFACGWMPGTGFSQDDESVETLYRQAAELAVEGKFQEAVTKYERLFELSTTFLGEDYGAQAGGIVFDYGSALVQLQEWEKARDAFERCHFFKEKECQNATSDLPNSRELLSLFQWGFCEAQLGNHDKAIELYDQYLKAVSGDPAHKDELLKIRNAYKLRYGASLVKVGRLEEGSAQISELFDNREAWQVAPQFLMQGLLELGLGWVEAADKAQTPEAKEQIEMLAQQFLDKNSAFLKVQPIDKFRYGMMDRLKKLGFESAQAGMHTLAIRYYSMVPTLEEVLRDVQSRLALIPGGAVPAAYQQVIDKINTLAAKPIPPDVELLRLMAISYERLGNYHAPRAINWHVVEYYPELEAERRAEVLHEAARFSTMIGDYPSAQVFGETFMAEMPADHKLRNQVESFMLQSLFTAAEYDRVIEICEQVRERFEPGSVERELADTYYGLALYRLQRFEEAAPALDEYLKNYEEGQSREMVYYHAASVRLILGEFRKGATLLEEFIAEFPTSERFLDIALADLALARFNLEDLTASIAAVERLEKERPDSAHLDRCLNVKADCYIVMGDDSETDEGREELRKQSLDTYLQAVEVGEGLIAKAEAEGKDLGLHKESVGEALAKATDIHVVDENCEEAIKIYDQFFPDYVGTRLEAQISVYTIDCLAGAGRAEDGLKQIEKMIVQIGNQPAEQQDLQLLREAIGSYSNASVEFRGHEETLKIFDNFPGLDPNNVVLVTWMKMQKVIVLQDMRGQEEKDSPEHVAINTRIDQVFKELELIKVKDLSEIALKMIGDYFFGSDNPFLAVSYYEELLLRENPDADQFKASADLNLGQIETRSKDPSKLQQARERFLRIINVYEDKELEPEAWFALGIVEMERKEWEAAKDAFQWINEHKKVFNKDLPKRAKAGFHFGECLEQLNDPGAAIRAYLNVWNVYGNIETTTAEAFEKWLEIGLKDAELLEDPIEVREKKIEYYVFLKKKLYQWQNWDKDAAENEALRRLQVRLPDLNTELGITNEEETAIDFKLGINQEKP